MNLSNQFLEKFTKELILNSAPAYILEEIEEKRRESFRKKINLELEPKIDFKVKPEVNFPKEMKPSLLGSNLDLKQSLEDELPVKEKEIEIKPLEKSKGLEKIDPLIQNQTISGIECPGPGKFIQIHKGVNQESIKLTLDKDEIESILSHFAEETNTSRKSDVFKAILNNLVITAIDSEFGGPRFIITKIHSKESEYL